MVRRYAVVGLVFMGFVGCVEIQQLMMPETDPDARFNYDFETNDNADDITTNGVDSDDTDLDDLVRRINAGNVGDIPAISEDIEQIITDSGLRYFDIVAGDGEIPEPDSTVTVNYTGWLAEDGTEFDSNDTVQFNLQSLIAGWTEGISSMQVGGTRRLIIPPELGYGEMGSLPNIPPDAWLVFDVKLDDIE